MPEPITRASDAGKIKPGEDIDTEHDATREEDFDETKLSEAERQRLEKLLIAGLDSGPPVPLDWEAMRRRASIALPNSCHIESM